MRVGEPKLADLIIATRSFAELRLRHLESRVFVDQRVTKPSTDDLRDRKTIQSLDAILATKVIFIIHKLV
jgi:hypothetical protein